MKADKICKSAAPLCIILFAVTLSLTGASSYQDIDKLRTSFANPPDDCRIMMRWWWFGPAVTKPELEREMKLMKEGGIGGFEVQPVYPLALDDESLGIKNLPYLSDEFLEALRFTSGKARELGLRMDLTLGSGWPFGGAQVSVRDAAGKLRVARVRVADNTRSLPAPSLADGEKLIAAFLHRQSQPAANDEIRELTEMKEGAFMIPTDLQGPHEALFFISSRTRMMVKRPAVGAEGFVLNHYDRSAVEGYLKNVGDRLLQPLRPDPPYAVFCDSLEVYDSDWTDDFLEEFRKRRGYDLKPYLPALVLDLGYQSAAMRYLWGKTLTELFNDRFMVPLHEWSKKNRTFFRVQGYGIPPATIASNAHADISEGEGAQWRTLSASRWASSANHLFGRTVTSSETWTWLHSPVFRATPLDMKAEANLHFLQGINQLIGHGWPYSAENAEYPGWRFYAAGVFNEKNPWWIVMPDITKYLQRASYLLRQGQPANDIAFYLPVSDAYASFSPGRVNLIEGLRTRIGPDAIPAVLNAGFNIDFFDDEVLKLYGKVENSALVLGANKYRAIILPNVERIPLETLRTLVEFARSGGTLIASRRRPETTPGIRDAAPPTAEIQSPSQLLFAALSEKSRFVEDEKNQLGATLRSMLQPDVQFTPDAPAIGFVHRKTNDAEIYFLANTANTRLDLKALCRVAGMQADWWDPMSGQITPAKWNSGPEGMKSVELDLEPYGARFLVFSKRLPATPTRLKPDELGQLDISEGWRITLGTVVKTMDHLDSWIGDDATRFFSGVAVYEKNISVPENMVRPDLPLWLDFGTGKALPEVPRSNGMQAWFEGPVREAAVVYVNDKRAGSVWCPPYRVNVAGLIKSGGNIIKIQVANTAVNHMAGRPLPDYRQLNQRYGTRFEPQDMDKIQPVASGLVGPIRLMNQ
jgi:hypothetical protein